MKPPRLPLVERAIAAVSPAWGAARAKAAFEALRYRRAEATFRRHYQAATMGGRSRGWTAPETSASGATYGVLPRLRARARELHRNNGWIKNAHRAVATATIGSGIVLSIKGEDAAKVERARKLWKKWAESTDIDADGRHNLYGLQRQVIDAVTLSGSVLFRHRPRKLSDNLALPLQVQVLEPDFLDTLRDTVAGYATGGRVIGGIEFDPLGRRAGYWLHRSHPGDYFAPYVRESVFVPADRCGHVYWEERRHLVDGVPWSTPCIIRARDFDEFEDARLLREKVAACFVAVEHDIEPLDGVTDPEGDNTSNERKAQEEEELSPATILKAGAGRDFRFGNPPGVAGYTDYAVQQLRLFAAAFGVTYETVSRDYSRTNFSSSRAAWLDMRANVEDWRWQMIVPQFLDVVWRWFVEVAAIVGEDFGDLEHEWTPPRYWMQNPREEVVAVRDAIRAGLQTPSGALRELGVDPHAHWDEFAEDLAEIDRRGIVLDADPRPHEFSEVGLRQPKKASASGAKAAGAKSDAAAAKSEDAVAE